MEDFLQDPIGFILIAACFYGGAAVLSAIFGKESKETPTRKKVLYIILILFVFFLTKLHSDEQRALLADYTPGPCSRVAPEDYEDCLDVNYGKYEGW